MPDNAETVITEAETVEKEPRFYSKTQEAAKLVIEHGVDPKEALMLTTGRIPDSGNLSRFTRKVSKYALSRPGVVKLAHQAALNILKGTPMEIEQQKVNKAGEIVNYTEKIAPTFTNQAAIIGMVYDRVEPVVRQNVNLNLNADISPVDLDRYR